MRTSIYERRACFIALGTRTGCRHALVAMPIRCSLHLASDFLNARDEINARDTQQRLKSANWSRSDCTPHSNSFIALHGPPSRETHNWCPSGYVFECIDGSWDFREAVGHFYLASFFERALWWEEGCKKSKKLKCLTDIKSWLIPKAHTLQKAPIFRQPTQKRALLTP